MNFKCNKGFTLVELIIAIALLGIIVITILYVYTHAYIWVLQAGQRTEVILEEQNAIEQALSETVAENYAEMQLDFFDLDSNKAYEIQVVGGTIQLDHLQTFVVNAPSIRNLEVKVDGEIASSHLYGDEPFKLDVSFDIFEIPKDAVLSVGLAQMDDEGNYQWTHLKENQYVVENQTSYEEAIYLNTHITRLQPGPYAIMIDALVEGRSILYQPMGTNYFVAPINYLMLSGDAYWVSNDQTTWKDINVTAFFGTSIQSMFYANQHFFAVDDSKIWISDDGLNWTSNSYDSDIVIKDIIYVSAWSQYIAVGEMQGDDGILIRSADGKDWSLQFNLAAIPTQAYWYSNEQKLFLSLKDASMGYVSAGSNTLTTTNIVPFGTILGFEPLTSNDGQERLILYSQENVYIYNLPTGAYTLGSEPPNGISIKGLALYEQSFVLVLTDNAVYKLEISAAEEGYAINWKVDDNYQTLVMTGVPGTYDDIWFWEDQLYLRTADKKIWTLKNDIWSENVGVSIDGFIRR